MTIISTDMIADTSAVREIVLNTPAAVPLLQFLANDSQSAGAQICFTISCAAYGSQSLSLASNWKLTMSAYLILDDGNFAAMILSQYVIQQSCLSTAQKASQNLHTAQKFN